MPGFDEIGIVFDATSAKAHIANAAKLGPYGKRLIDLTPAAIGPYVVPGGQPRASTWTRRTSTWSPAAARRPSRSSPPSSRVTPVRYAEIVASIASKSAGPGTRANIDEFTETTARAIENVGGARRGKAIIILNPAEPPLIMRDTVYCLTGDADREAIDESIAAMVGDGRRTTCPATGSSSRCSSTASATDEPAATPSTGMARRPTAKVSYSSKWKAQRTTCPPTRATSTS